MTSGQRVLVVDGLEETTEVLRAVLEPRGLQVNRIRHATADAKPATTTRPNVVVLHHENGNGSRESAGNWAGIPSVIIGRQETDDACEADLPPTQRYLPHPFQYDDLIQTIERLLT